MILVPAAQGRTSVVAAVVASLLVVVLTIMLAPMKGDARLGLPSADPKTARIVSISRYNVLLVTLVDCAAFWTPSTC